MFGRFLAFWKGSCYNRVASHQIWKGVYYIVKRFLSFFLLFALLCGLYSCTGSQSSESESQSESEGESESESESKTEVIETEDGLRVFAVGDIHYTSGENEAYNNPAIAQEAQYAITPEDRMQRMIDGILAEHEKKPIDAVLILGDIGNNDHSFQYFYKHYSMGLYYNAETDKFEDSVRRWDNWKDYMFNVFYQSEYDCIYQVKVRYLDQLTANGIPYYVTSGNHDAYTDDMWRDCFGPKYDENGDLIEASHIGDAGQMEYVIEFPEKDAAFIMLDNFSYDEQLDEAGDTALGIRYSYFMKNDNVPYAALEKNQDRKEWFEQAVEDLQYYKHLYVGGHYFDGDDVEYGGGASDWGYITSAGNKYGNLRLLMYAHQQSTYESRTNGVLCACVAHWSVSMSSGSYINPETGEKRAVLWSILHSPWGYSVIESDAESCEFYRIDVAGHYEWDIESGIYGNYLEMVSLKQNPGLVAGEFDVLTPYKQPVDIPYRVYRAYTLYPPEKVNTSPRDP